MNEEWNERWLATYDRSCELDTNEKIAQEGLKKLSTKKIGFFDRLFFPHAKQALAQDRAFIAAEHCALQISVFQARDQLAAETRYYLQIAFCGHPEKMAVLDDFIQTSREVGPKLDVLRKMNGLYFSTRKISSTIPETETDYADLFQQKPFVSFDGKKLCEADTLRLCLANTCVQIAAHSEMLDGARVAHLPELLFVTPDGFESLGHFHQCLKTGQYGKVYRLQKIYGWIDEVCSRINHVSGCLEETTTPLVRKKDALWGQVQTLKLPETMSRPLQNVIYNLSSEHFVPEGTRNQRPPIQDSGWGAFHATLQTCHK